MEDTKSSSVDSHSPVNERTDNEASETKEEKRLLHVTLPEKEVIENDENGQLLPGTAEFEALESVHKYAKRIKSFLGWEAHSEQQENDTPECDEINKVGDLVRDESEVKDGDDDVDEEEVGSETHEGGSAENKEATGYTEDGSDAIIATDLNDKTPEIENQQRKSDDDELTPDSKGNAEWYNHVKVDSHLEDDSDVISKRDSPDISLENETEQEKSDEELLSEIKDNNTDLDNHEEVDSNLENSCSKTDLINNNESEKKLTENRIVFLGTENVNKKDQDTLQKTAVNIRSDSIGKCNLANEVGLTENNGNLFLKADETLQEMGSENSTTGKALETSVEVPTSSDDRNLGDISKTAKKCLNPEEKDQDLNSENHVLSESEDKHIMNELGINKKDGISDTLGNTDDDKLAPGNDAKIVASEGDEVNEKNLQPGDTIPLENTEKRTESENEQERLKNSQDDLESKESLGLDEDISLKNGINKPYIDEIRRLSMDIVKDIIECARNSVHEIFANKNEETEERNDSKDLDSLTNNDQIESRYNNDNTCSEDNSSVKTNDSVTKNNKLSTEYYSESTSKRNSDSFESKNIENQNGLSDRKDSISLDENIVCGYGCFKPRWIQKYSRPRIFLILFSIIGVIHGCYYAYFVSIISTLEKRYAFKTKVSGTLLLADEITPLILGVIVGYIGSRTHRPRMVAIGMFMSVACCFISGLPYLIYGPSKHLSFIKYTNETGPEVCDAEARSTECDADDTPPTLTVVGIFLLASFLKGFATLSYYVIGIPYMDDNIKKKNSPMYLAIALALRLLGPLFGFLMSSAFLKLYENPTVDPGYGSDDPRWIGAWWIGFFLQGILLFIFTLPIALFPRRLPGQRSVETNTAPASQDGLKQIFAGLLSALKRLGTNPVFILLIVNTNMKIFGHFGHSIMLPKYMENQFRLSASEASLYSGATSITFVMLSTILGGYLIWKFRPRIKVLLAGMIASEIILCVGFLILVIPRCQIVDMVNFGMSNDGLILDSACNQKCDCSTTSYTPFCGPEGTTYFSPCYAGCTQELVTSSMSYMHHKEFRNCSCVAFSTNRSMVSTISEGICPDEKCWSQAIIYLVIYFFLLSISNAFTVAHSMILLRSVHPNDKSIALGTFETFICLFGFIPFPVTFGALVDSACLVWEKSCGEIGNCWFYDMKKYSYLLHGVGALFCSFSVMCLIGLYFLSSRVRDLYVDEDVEKEYVDIKLDTVSGTVTKL